MGSSQCRVESHRGAAWEVDHSTQDQPGATFKVRQLPRGPNGPCEAHSQCVGCLFVKRRPGFYIHNYVFVLFLMTLMSFGAFAVPITDVAGRCSITVTMFLTVVSLKLLMASQLPRKPNVTQMEMYVASAFMLTCIPMLGQVSFLFLSCNGNGISDLVHSENPSLLAAHLVADGYDCQDWVAEADRQLMLLLSVLLALLHAVYGLFWFFGCRLPRNSGLFVILLLLLGGAWSLLASTGWLSQNTFEPWAWWFWGVASA